MVGEDVAQRLAQERRGAAALVDEADGAADHERGLRMRTPHHDGPTGADEVAGRAQVAARSTASGSCGSARPAGPKMHARRRRPGRTSSSGRGRRAPGRGSSAANERLAIQRDRAARVRADLRVGDDPARRPSPRLAGRSQRVRRQPHDDERRGDAAPGRRPPGTRCRTSSPRSSAARAAGPPRRRAAGRAATASGRARRAGAGRARRAGVSAREPERAAARRAPELERGAAA